MTICDRTNLVHSPSFSKPELPRMLYKKCPNKVIDTCACLFQPHTIRIGHLGRDNDASWYLDEVIVDIPSRNEHYLYPCHSWLAADRGDGKTDTELYAGECLY